MRRAPQTVRAGRCIRVSPSGNDQAMRLLGALDFRGSLADTMYIYSPLDQPFGPPAGFCFSERVARCRGR